MVNISTSTTDFDQTVTALVRRQILDELRGQNVHMRDALPARYVPGTNSMTFVAYRDLDITTGTPTPGTPPWLTEGTAPTAEALTIGYDTMVAYQAGRSVGLTDVARTQSPHDLYAVASERIAFNAVSTIDKYIADVIGAGTNVIYGGDATSTATLATGDVLTISLIKQAVATLASANVPRFSDGTYHCVIHPASVYDLMIDTTTGGWIDGLKYTDNQPLKKGYLGSLAGVSFWESSYAYTEAEGGTSSADAYSTVIYGPDAWAFGDMQTLEVYTVRGADKADPLNQVDKVSWKAMWGAALLDNNGARYIRIETVSALG